MNHQPEVGSIPWREWGEDAFMECRRDRKPVLLALTATWCHWCHVMDETSYSDSRVIDLVKSQFIPVRVDVDRRPDISRRYNQGGFPSLAILNGRGELLAGRIYTPPEEMVSLLQQVVAGHPEPSLQTGQPRLERETTGPRQQLVGNSQDLPASTRVLRRLKELYDPDFGGFGGEPKQPPWEGLRLLMALYSRSGEKDLLNMVLNSLDGMKGGLYDLNDGGFFRYSVARDWKVPHYEKMAVTNANLAILYLEAYQLTRRRVYKDIAVGTLDYLLNTLHKQSGELFYSSQDAWEDYYRLPWKDRETAIKPTVDKAAYTGWNALCAGAFVKGYSVLGKSSYANVAAAALERLWSECWNPDLGMAHVIGGPQVQPPVLEDHVFFVRASLDLYQATGHGEHLQRAIHVAQYIQRVFGAPDGGCYDTCGDPKSSQETLLREKPVLENSLLAEALATISSLTGEEEYLRLAEDTLKPFEALVPDGSYLGPQKSRRMEEDEEWLFLPAGSAWARAWDMVSRGPVHLVIAGGVAHPRTKRLLMAALKIYAPHRVTQILDPEQDGQRIASLGFPVREEPTLYACFDGMCLAPITSAADVSRFSTTRPWTGR